MFFKDKSIKISLPRCRELYGVKIVKLPIARYVSALNVLENLPHIIASELMPEAGSMEELLGKLTNADRETIEIVFTKLITTIPKELCRLISELLNIPEERLLDKNCKNPLSPNELTEIITAFWEVNDMSDFFGNVRKLTQRLTARNQTANIGYSGGLQ